jgi:hypothetical protein
MAHSHFKPYPSNTRLHLLWRTMLISAMSTLRQIDECAKKLERNDITMKFEEYYYYFQDNEHKMLLMATLPDYIYFESWQYWNPPVFEVM